MTEASRAEFSLKGKRVWVAGHRGMVGGAIVRRLASEECTVLKVGREAVDLCRQAEVEAWMQAEKPDAVVIAAARVGGIVANSSFPADFIYDNMMIEANIVRASYDIGVQKLLFLGSSCIYPKLAQQPMSEDALLTGPLEPTNQWYAVAKIAGIKLCQAYREQHGCDFISAMPTNLYGPGDNFDLTTSHVIPAMIRKITAARDNGQSEVEIWGTGTPMREFLYVDDMADACVHLLKTYSGAEHVNIGTGTDVTIREVAEAIARVIGFTGSFRYDSSKPDGTPRKLLNVDRLKSLGWTASTSLEDGLHKAVAWFEENRKDARGADTAAPVPEKVA